MMAAFYPEAGIEATAEAVERAIVAIVEGACLNFIPLLKANVHEKVLKMANKF